MTARMPKKGTPEYRAYWRDRHMLENLKLQRIHLGDVVALAESGRRTLFELSLRQFDEAIATFELGWKFSYVDDEGTKT